MKTTAQKLFITIALLALSLLCAAFTYSPATKTARMAAVRDQVDAGSGAGKLEIGPAGMGSVCVTVAFDDPSGTASSGVLTFSGFPKSVTASATCTAAAARIRDSADNDIMTGLTVGTSGADIIVDNTSINSGQNVNINSTTITHAP